MFVASRDLFESPFTTRTKKIRKIPRREKDKRDECFLSLFISLSLSRRGSFVVDDDDRGRSVTVETTGAEFCLLRAKGRQAVGKREYKLQGFRFVDRRDHL